MDAVWDQILKFLAQIITPDWGSLIALLPLAILGLVVLYLLYLGVSYARAGPTRRGRQRITPIPPPGVHPPVPSFAPFFGAIATFLVLFALVAGGIAIPLALIGMVLALLYWGREAMAEHDHLLGTERAEIEPATTEPPPGVHAPVPSFQPILASIALAIIFFGLVFGPALLLVGVVTLVISLVGWLRDARREYRLVEQADETGHLAPPPAPAFPIGTLALFAVLIAGGILVQAGVFPPRTSTTAAAGSSPAASGGTSGAGASPPPSAAPAPKGDVTIVAEGIQFTTADVSGPAGKPFTVSFTNKDQGTDHNVEIKNGGGQEVFKGDLVKGVASTLYNVPALPAGSYPFSCTVHPTMTGTLTAK
jgi:plastocyanin